MENVIALPRPSTRQYKWDERTIERLDKLADLLPHQDEVDVLRVAVGHFLSTLERDERVLMTVPSEQAETARGGHKRPDRGA